MKKVGNLLWFFFFILTLIGCEHDDVDLSFLITERYIFIHNNTPDTVFFYSTVKHSGEVLNIQEVDTLFPVAPYRQHRNQIYDLRHINAEVHILVYTKNTMEQLSLEGIKENEFIEKYYKIKCSELEENYNTVIIYDDDDTSKW